MEQHSRTKANEKGFPTIALIGIFFITLFALLIGKKYLSDDFNVILSWWLGMLGCGIAFYPLSHAAFNRFSDGGYVIAKALGIEMSSWFIWTLSTFKLFKFTHTNTIICLSICAVLNYVIYFIYCKKKNKPYFGTMNTDKFAKAVFYEAVFLFVFMAFCYMKSFRVTITNDTEKYMDFGFLASIMNSEYMPPSDMWYSGEYINYYYYGIYVAGYLGKLANTTAGYAYNLDLMTICSLGFVQSYALVAELIRYAGYEYNKRNKERALKNAFLTETKLNVLMHAGGVLAGLSVFIAGNMHYVLYACIYPFMEKVMGLEVQFYWFPNSTRFITDGTSSSDGTLIHEFPSYSFVLGDLHAHVTDITNVLLIISVLFGFVLNRRERMENARKSCNFEIATKDFLIKEALDPAIIIASFLIGIIRMTNSWDFPIYFVVSGAILMFSNAIITGFNMDTLKITGVHAAECVVISIIVSLPFTFFFDSMTAGIGVCEYHSNPYELAVLWALPLSVSIGLYVIAINRYREDKKSLMQSMSKKGNVKKEVIGEDQYIYSTVKPKKGEQGVPKKKINDLYSFIFRSELTDLYILTLAICAAGLVLMCELIYVKDIYGGYYQRTNTMFKLGYQAFILFAIVMSYGITRLVGFYETKKQLKLSIAALCFLVWTFGYFKISCDSYVGDLTDSDSKVRTLDSYETIVEAEKANGYINSDYNYETDERTDVLDKMIKWINENVEKDAIIAQMPSTAYKPFATISAYTGRSAVIGWSNHEWLWRNGGTLDYPESVRERVYAMLGTPQNDENGKEFFAGGLYNTDDVDTARAICKKYNIDYIYVGYTETLLGTEFFETETEGYRYYRGTWYKPNDYLNHDVLKSLGEVVYDAGTCSYAGYHYVWDSEAGNYVYNDDGTLVREYGYDYEYEAYIVKVNKD